MSDVASWIHDKLNAHRIGADNSPAAAQRLLSACAALAGRGGTVFGLAQPAGGFPDAVRFYPLGCSILGEWVTTLEQGELRSQLVEAIRRNNLDVALPDATTREPALRADGEIRPLIQRLKAAGCRVLRAEEEAPPTHAEVESLAMRLAPRALPDSVRAWATKTSTRMALQWTHEPTMLHGSLDYDIAAIPGLHQACAKQVAEWLEGLPHYYRVWATALPILRTESGFIAVNDEGAVLYLDDEGRTELNGLQLAKTLEGFWETWRKLAFVALDVATLERIRAHGFSAAGVGQSGDEVALLE